MYKKSLCLVLTVIVSALFITEVAALSAEKEPSLVLFDFSEDFNIGSVVTSDAKITLPRSGTLRIETGHKNQWPGITLKAPAGKWDLSKYEYVSIDVKNNRTEPVTAGCRVDNPDADGSKNCVSR